MKIFRSYSFRVYLTNDQATRVRRWEDALRWLWNIAQEHILQYLSRGSRCPSSFDQIKQLPELRAFAPWLNDAPADACYKIIFDLATAWQRCFKKVSRRPVWKKKGRDTVNVGSLDCHTLKILSGGFWFPKLGMLRTASYKSYAGICGKPKQFMIKCDVDQWFLVIIFEQEVPDPATRITPVIGIDRGITNLVADSYGSVVPNPKHWEKMQNRLARAQRIVARRKKGSKNRAKAKLIVAKIHRKIRRQRAHTLHELSAEYARTFGVVVVEDLNVAGMGKGKLARQIHGAGWSTFLTMLKYKIEATGGRVELVPAAYSSQTCAQCQNVDKTSRQGERYNCVRCGNQAHADVNAAKVLVQRYDSRRSDGEAVRGGSGEECPPKKRKNSLKLRAVVNHFARP